VANRGGDTMPAPAQPPGNDVLQRPSTAGTFVRRVALTDSALGPWVGSRPGADRVPRTLRRSVMSLRSAQSDIANTTCGLNVAPRKERDADASSRVPTNATLATPGRGFQDRVVPFHAYNAVDVIRPVRPRTSSSRSAMIPPNGMPIASRSSVSTYAMSTSSPATRRTGAGGLDAFTARPGTGVIVWVLSVPAPIRIGKAGSVAVPPPVT